jgi:hypothetical protein
MRTATRTRGLRDLCLLSMVAILAGCGSTVSTPHASTSPSSASTASTGRLPRPCSFLTQAIAAQVSGDPNVSNQATNVLETESGYVACIFADTKDEANSAAVQIKRVSGGVDSSTLRAAATSSHLENRRNPFNRSQWEVLAIVLWARPCQVLPSSCSQWVISWSTLGPVPQL